MHLPAEDRCLADNPRSVAKAIVACRNGDVARDFRDRPATHGNHIRNGVQAASGVEDR